MGEAKLHINSLFERLDESKISMVERLQRYAFLEWIKDLKISKNSIGLSVSVGNGIWDYLVFLHNKNIKKIIATDIIDNPVKKNDIGILRKVGKWEFKKVTPEEKLPFKSNYFDLIFHQDVVEHTRKSYLFLSEQFRVLKNGGSLVFGTPNLLRPVNLIKLILNRLSFPINLGSTVELGDCIHIQEFTSRQIVVMLEEIGFKNIEVKYCFFGIHVLNLTFKKYLCKDGCNLCHFLMFKCSK